MSTGAATATSIPPATSVITTAGTTNAIESEKLGDKSFVVHILSLIKSKNSSCL